MTTRENIKNLIGLDKVKFTNKIKYKVIEEKELNGYIRQKIEYISNKEIVPAYLLLPNTLSNNPAIIISHQHNGERHLGKSEVVGIEGNKYQAFGEVLVKLGFVVLAPDAICFEDRRNNIKGIKPSEDNLDFYNHLNEMSYRILNGDLLIKRNMIDSINGVTLLSNLPFVDKSRIGALGHSMGGNTTMFLSCLDERIKYTCVSGCACTFKTRMERGTGIELSSIIPNFTLKYDIDDVLKCICPRKLLIVSASEDKYSYDADKIELVLGKEYEKKNANDKLTHLRFEGGHPLTKDRFIDIINWIKENNY